MARSATFWFRFAVAAIALLCAGQSFAQSSQDVAVIVNPKNNVDNLSMAELAKIFRGERQYWRTDLPVLLLLRAPGSYEREVALRSIFRMTESQYKQYWISRIMRAEATSPPAELYSSGMTKEGVSSISGAIGCISASDVKQGVKVVRVNGRLPGEAGYPLH
jgi:ABC-type phosphate transport system substrate-binding protein